MVQNSRHCAGAQATVVQNCAGTKPCVQLRNMSVAPGTSYKVTMTLQALCSAAHSAGTQWNVQAKQANNFNGSGNDLNLDLSGSSLTTAVTGNCTLSFDATGQPHNALIAPAVITNTDYNSPPGGPVVVDVLSADGKSLSGYPVAVALQSNPGGASLGGTTPVTSQNGRATFTDLTVNQPDPGYTLVASSTGFVSGVSNPFDVGQFDVRQCGTGQCTTSVSNGNGGALLTASPGTGAGLLTLSVFTGTQKQLDCGSSLDQNTFEFEYVTTTGGRNEFLQITVRPPDTSYTQSVLESLLPSQDICFGATVTFVTKGGTLAKSGTLPDGSSGYIGLLPDCDPDDVPPDGDNDETSPCHARSSSNQGGAAYIDQVKADSASPSGYSLVLSAFIPASYSTDPWSR